MRKHALAFVVFGVTFLLWATVIPVGEVERTNYTWLPAGLARRGQVLWEAWTQDASGVKIVVPAFVVFCVARSCSGSNSRVCLWRSMSSSSRLGRRT